MAVTNYIWDELSDNVLIETDENNVPTAEYTHWPEQFGELISQKRSGVTSYYHYDGAHSTRLLTDDSGAITDTYIFSAYGELVARTGTTTNPFGYKGAVGYYTNAATNDIYVRARSYQPVTGRWLSMDPLGFVDGPNLNRAYFVPRGVDPTGTMTVSTSSDTSLSQCGGYRTKILYQADLQNAKDVKVITYVQLLCLFDDDSFTRDCTFVSEDCCAMEDRKPCTSCCILEELITTFPGIPGEDTSVIDINNIDRYTTPGCTSQGKVVVKTVVRAFRSEGVIDGIQKTFKPAGKFVCQTGCRGAQEFEVGRHLVIDDFNRDIPDWFLNNDLIVDETNPAVTTTNTWSCCGKCNWQLGKFPDRSLSWFSSEGISCEIGLPPW